MLYGSLAFERAPLVAERNKKLISSRSGKDLWECTCACAPRQEKTRFWHRTERDFPDELTFNQIIAIIAKWRGARSTADGYWLIGMQTQHLPLSLGCREKHSLYGRTCAFPLGSYSNWTHRPALTEKREYNILSPVVHNDFPSLFWSYLHSSKPQRRLLKAQ